MDKVGMRQELEVRMLKDRQARQGQGWSVKLETKGGSDSP